MNNKIKKNLFFALAALMLVACKPVTPPQEVAVNLFNSLTSGDMSYVKENIHFAKSMDYDVACEFFDLLVNSKDYKTGTAGYKADYKAVKITHEGDVVWVELQGVSPTGESLSTVARMILVDGKWKVDGDYTMLHSFKRP